MKLLAVEDSARCGFFPLAHWRLHRPISFLYSYPLPSQQLAPKQYVPTLQWQKHLLSKRISPLETFVEGTEIAINMTVNKQRTIRLAYRMLPKLIDIVIGLIMFKIAEPIEPFVVFIGPLHTSLVLLCPFKKKRVGNRSPREEHWAVFQLNRNQPI